MSGKKTKDHDGIVYSTNKDFDYYNMNEDFEVMTLPPDQQNLRIWVEKKAGGKKVTLITGFIGKTEDLKELEKKLKNKFGTGGSVKDGDLLIQGDIRDKIIDFLIKNGYKAKKAGG